MVDNTNANFFKFKIIIVKVRLKILMLASYL